MERLSFLKSKHAPFFLLALTDNTDLPSKRVLADVGASESYEEEAPTPRHNHRLLTVHPTFWVLPLAWVLRLVSAAQRVLAPQQV